MLSVRAAFTIRLSQLAALALCCLVPVMVLAQQVSIDVQGDYPELKENAEAFVGEVKGRTARELRRSVPTNVKKVSRALRAMGYYNPTIDWELERDEEEPDEKKSARLIISVVPGEPVRVISRKVEINGAAASDEDFTQNLPNKPSEGDVLNHGEYASLRGTIESRARRRGYFDGKFTTSTLAVNPEAGTAEITLIFESGERYALGEVTFEEGHWFELGLLEDFVTFEPGIPYHADEVAQLNRNLSSSGYFAGIEIEAPPEDAVDGVIPVSVSLTRREPRSVSTGVGFSTDVGPRFRGNWLEHWLNPMGHRRGAEIEFSEPRQNLSAYYELPLDPPMTDLIRLTAGFQREDIDNVESELITIGQQWQHQLDNDWLQVLSIRWEGERFNIRDEERGTSSLFLPGAAYSKIHADSPLDPSRGYRLQFDITGSHRALLSKADILHASVLAKGLYTVFDRHRFVGRFHVGGVATNDFSDVPPSLRFFAGGDQSVRGYGYETLSPDNENGVPVGGRFLLVSSGEYQYGISDRWRAAVFVDHGNAINNFNDPLATGVGIGVRWISPVGPLRLDIAKGLDREFGGDWRLHFSMGPEL
ncbi:outer membrane protein assembly factor [Marinobacter salinisoli]|uniref:Translocation and assembly module subunit TamA n=1 Tax=Marinobacter salinisoli TaxID=2769486 RepID=A0ABX7MQ52_9GAMM|nr:autotransporter assembly complex family protein [Marinobacter salinisoli]QSP94423.1 outer membrane protein assembly factor [Marinobacter salinisoli]